MSKYVVGDIHGCFDTFMRLVDKILADGGALSDIVLVGDLIDRGGKSSAVVEYVKNNKIHCVLGNHEQMMIDWAEDKEYKDDIWTMNGGTETLASYGANGNLLNEHVAFLKTLPLYLEFPEELEGRKLFVSHAGLQQTDDENIQIALARDIPNKDIMWHRWDIGDFPGYFQVIGHTPKKAVVKQPHYANVDTGCVFKGGGYYQLSCIKFPEMVVLSVKNCEQKFE